MHPYVIVRTVSAGCFAGDLVEQSHGEVVLLNARRLWHWKGAASLSQLAVDGTSKPNECKFPVEVERIIIFGVIEIISVTSRARSSIKEVPIWVA